MSISLTYAGANWVSCDSEFLVHMQCCENYLISLDRRRNGPLRFILKGDLALHIFLMLIRDLTVKG